MYFFCFQDNTDILAGISQEQFDALKNLAKKNTNVTTFSRKALELFYQDKNILKGRTVSGKSVKLNKTDDGPNVRAEPLTPEKVDAIKYFIKKKQSADLYTDAKANRIIASALNTVKQTLSSNSNSNKQ